MKIYASENSPGKETLPGVAMVFLDRHSRIREETGTEKQVVWWVNGGTYVENLQEKEQALHIKAGMLTVSPRQAGIYVSFDSSTLISAVHVLSGDAMIAAGENQFTLSAGESVWFDGRSSRLSDKQKADVNLSSYATKTFEFNDTPLGEAAALIEKAYDTKIVFANNKLPGCRITTRFDHKTLEEILDIMAYTLHFTYWVDEKNNQVLLTNEGYH